MSDSKTYEKACSFAIRVVALYKCLKSEHNEYVMSKQLLRCGTSIGANIAEALGAISDADFSFKLSIAYKESLETKYWLTLLKNTHFMNDSIFKSMFSDADELAKMLFCAIKTTKRK